MLSIINFLVESFFSKAGFTFILLLTASPLVFLLGQIVVTIIFRKRTTPKSHMKAVISIGVLFFILMSIAGLGMTSADVLSAIIVYFLSFIILVIIAGRLGI